MCWDQIGAGSSVNALENHSLYDKAIKAPGVEDEIKRIFNKIDVSGDGSLEVDELDEIVGIYQGHAFDEDEVSLALDCLPSRSLVPQPTSAARAFSLRLSRGLLSRAVLRLLGRDGRRLGPRQPSPRGLAQEW